MEFPRNRHTSEPVGGIVLAALGLWAAFWIAVIVIAWHFLAKFW